MDARPRQIVDPTNPSPLPRNKISIFGAGRIGTASGFVMMLQRITNHIVFFDKVERMLQAQMLDLQPYSASYRNTIVEGTCNDYSKLTNSQICIIAAGARILPGENKLDLLQKNVEILRSIIPHIKKHCPNCILLIVTNPIDIISYFAWKMSDFPASRIFGIGHLYSKSFQYEIAKHLKVSPDILSGLIVGEYGDSGVSLWSGVHIAGSRIRDVNPDFGTAKDEEKSGNIYKMLFNIPHKTTVLKGYSSWAPACCVADITRAILRNTNEIFSLSVLAKGIANIDKNIFLSVPCEVGSNGVSRCVIPRMSKDELKRFEKSADVLDKKIKKCTFWTVNSPAI